MATVQVRYIVGDVDAAIAFVKQAVVEGPSDNPVELFEALRSAAGLEGR